MATTHRSHGIQAVVFDVGGVLLDWNPEHLYRRLIPDEDERHRFLSHVCTPDWNAAQDAGRSWAEAIAELPARFPESAELITAYDEQWEGMVAGPIEESVAVLRELRRAGIPVYALTNFSGEKWSVAVDRWKFLGDFDGCVISGEEGIIKPDPRIFQTLLQRYGLQGRRTFYVDDHPANVEQARQFGIDAEVFVDGVTLRRQLRARRVTLDGG